MLYKLPCNRLILIISVRAIIINLVFTNECECHKGAARERPGKTSTDGGAIMGIKKNSLDKLLGNSIWDFFIKKQENANCSICDIPFKCLDGHRYRHINEHMKNKHNEKYDKHVQKYTEIQENLVKCDFCPEVFDVPFHINPKMKNHFYKEHGIDCDYKPNHDNISKYISDHFKKLGFQKLQCNKCNEVLREVCYFQLRKHLDICQQINTSTEISSMRKSSRLLSSDGNVKDIDTSSGDPQPGSSTSLDIDVDDRDSGMKDLKSECGKSSKSESFLRSDENIENIPTSSGDPKAGSSKDSDTEVRDVDHDRDSRKDLKRKLDNSGSLLSSDGNVKDIDTSSGDPQPGSSKSLDIDVDDLDSGMKKVKYDNDKCSSD